MSLVRVAHRTPIVAHRRRPPRIPRIFPILQPPTLSNQSDFIVDEKHHRFPVKKHPRAFIFERRVQRKLTEQIPIQMPTYIPQQNYPTQPYHRLITRSIRYAQPKYSPLMYPFRYNVAI